MIFKLINIFVCSYSVIKKLSLDLSPNPSTQAGLLSSVFVAAGFNRRTKISKMFRALALYFFIFMLG